MLKEDQIDNRQLTKTLAGFSIISFEFLNKKINCGKTKWTIFDTKNKLVLDCVFRIIFLLKMYRRSRIDLLSKLTKYFILLEISSVFSTVVVKSSSSSSVSLDIFGFRFMLPLRALISSSSAGEMGPWLFSSLSVSMSSLSSLSLSSSSSLPAPEPVSSRSSSSSSCFFNFVSRIGFCDLFLLFVGLNPPLPIFVDLYPPPIEW